MEEQVKVTMHHTPEEVEAYSRAHNEHPAKLKKYPVSNWDLGLKFEDQRDTDTNTAEPG